jgi:hypothetical protein
MPPDIYTYGSYAMYRVGHGYTNSEDCKCTMSLYSGNSKLRSIPHIYYVSYTVHPITHQCRHRRGVNIKIYSLISGPDGVGGQRHAPDTSPLGKRPGTHCTRDKVDLRDGMDKCGKSPPHRASNPGPSNP